MDNAGRRDAPAVVQAALTLVGAEEAQRLMAGEDEGRAVQVLAGGPAEVHAVGLLVAPEAPKRAGQPLVLPPALIKPCLV